MAAHSPRTRSLCSLALPREDAISPGLFGTVPRHSRAKAESQFNPASTIPGSARPKLGRAAAAVIIHPVNHGYTTHFLGSDPAGRYCTPA